MRIAACYKNVPDNEKIKLAPDNSLDLSAAAPQIGQYDLNAVEAAVEIAAGQPGTEIIALTVAGDVIDNTKQRKAILSRGADRMVGVKGEFENADTFEIASPSPLRSKSSGTWTCSSSARARPTCTPSRPVWRRGRYLAGRM